MSILAPSASAQSVLTRHPAKLIVMGDSLVYGYGDWAEGGWVERLRRRWMRAAGTDPILYNLGVRGDGVAQVQRRLESEFCRRGELRHRLPEGLILSVGINDSARLGSPRGRNVTEFSRFCDIWGQLLDQAQALCPVWVVGMVPVDEAKMPFLECFHFNHTDQHRYNQAMAQACQSRQIPFLDLFTDLQHPGRSADLGAWLSCLSEDGLHPNPEGYRQIFEQVLIWLPQTPTWSWGPSVHQRSLVAEDMRIDPVCL